MHHSKPDNYNYKAFILFFAVVIFIHLLLIYFISPFTGLPVRRQENPDIKIVTPDEYPQLRINRGNRYLDDGMLDEALFQFNKVLSKDPSSRKALNQAGWIYLLKRDPDESLKRLNLSIEMNPEDKEVYMMRAGAYIQKKDWDKALKDYNKAVKISPDDPAVYFGIGRLYLVKKDFARAEEYFDEALQRQPGQPVYILSRSFAYINQGKYKEAKYDAEMVLKNKNIDMDTRIGALLAIAEIEMVADKNYDKAREIYREVLEMREKLVLEKKNKKIETGKYKIFDFGFDHWENPHLGRAVTYMDNEEYEKALRELDMALNDPINPQPVAWLYMTIVYHNMGNREKAKENAKKWFSSSRYDIEHYHEEELAAEEATAYMVLGDFEKALEKINFAINIRREYIFNRALIYMEKGDYDKAREDLKIYIDEFPENENPDLVKDIRHAKKLLNKI